MGDIATQCSAKMREDPSILEHCMKIITGFNEHMSQLFNDTKDYVELILYN
jgi:hypothetical protein